jgi:hypothetical protein
MPTALVVAIGGPHDAEHRSTHPTTSGSKAPSKRSFDVKRLNLLVFRQNVLLLIYGLV